MYWWGCGDIGILIKIYFTGGNIKCVCIKNNFIVLQIAKYRIAIEPSNSTPRYKLSSEPLHMHFILPGMLFSRTFSWPLLVCY
jgi:hypothetical protein